MMSDFYAIDNYPFDIKLVAKTLNHFSMHEYLGRFYIIEYESKIVGYIILTFGFSFEYQGRDAFIDEFYIKPHFRHLGIGKATLSFVEDQADKLGVNAIHLEVEDHNSSAHKLYTCVGFKNNNRKLLSKKLKSAHPVHANR